MLATPACLRRNLRPIAPASLLVLGALISASPSVAAPHWPGYAGNAQHTARSTVVTQPLNQIIWQTPVDLNPQYTGDLLYIHYGSPLVTGSNVIVVPVKVGVTDSFRVEARNGSNGALLWQYDSDYTLPGPVSWTPSFTPALTPDGTLYFPGAAGTVLTVDPTAVETLAPPTPARLAFYGIANYNANPTGFADVKICTPLTSDSHGNVFFCYRGAATNPLGLDGGIARIAANSTGTYVSGNTVTGGLANTMLMNCAPALSPDEQTLYVAIRRPSSSSGYFVALDATTLALKSLILLRDPKTNSLARLANEGTASPMVAPDGTVFFGVLETPSFSNAGRGWLLKFDPNLNLLGPPGAFGWDDTPSLVPPSMVPSYTGSSPYLLMAKYNFYAGGGGDGVNKLAILDPNDTEIDAYTGLTVMKEVLTITGVTPDLDQQPTYPNAVREWCINTAAVDPATSSVLANSEDGSLYRWDLGTNLFSESIALTSGVGEAYTPTVVGHDGKVYAINNATLFAIGSGLTAVGGSRRDPTLDLAAPSPTPFSRATRLHFTLAEPGHVRLDILDLAGRRVTGLIDAVLPAGDHEAWWNGRDANGLTPAAGVYFARLAAGSQSVERKLVFTR